jgi:hypothetical protein
LPQDAHPSEGFRKCLEEAGLSTCSRSFTSSRISCTTSSPTTTSAGTGPATRGDSAGGDPARCSNLRGRRRIRCDHERPALLQGTSRSDRRRGGRARCWITVRSCGVCRRSYHSRASSGSTSRLDPARREGSTRRRPRRQCELSCRQ